MGSAWISGDLNRAAEHLATWTTLQQMACLCGRPRHRPAIGVSVVVAAAEGELHWVGASMIADHFFMEGLDVAFLGQNTPTDDLAELVDERSPELVILSVSQPDRLSVASKATTLLEGIDPAPFVFVGGSGLLTFDHTWETPPDLVSSDVLESIRVAAQLLCLQVEHPTLERHLRASGRAVQKLRKNRGWSQQELAGRAGLDRTYLGTVEQGKQNITMEQR